MLPYRNVETFLDDGCEIAPLLEAAARGEVRFRMIMHGDTLDPASPDNARSVLVVGDDPDRPSSGPKAFSVNVRGYVRAAAMIVVYSGTGAGSVYSRLVDSVKKTGRCAVVIQTQVRHHEDWMALVNREAPGAAVLEIHPSKGASAAVPGISRQQRRALARRGR
jgi:hypothetical protein